MRLPFFQMSMNATLKGAAQLTQHVRTLPDLLLAHVIKASLRMQPIVVLVRFH